MDGWPLESDILHLQITSSFSVAPPPPPPSVLVNALLINVFARMFILAKWERANHRIELMQLKHVIFEKWVNISRLSFLQHWLSSSFCLKTISLQIFMLMNCFHFPSRDGLKCKGYSTMSPRIIPLSTFYPDIPGHGFVNLNQKVL